MRKLIFLMGFSALAVHIFTLLPSLTPTDFLAEYNYALNGVRYFFRLELAPRPPVSTGISGFIGFAAGCFTLSLVFVFGVFIPTLFAFCWAFAPRPESDKDGTS